METRLCGCHRLPLSSPCISKHGISTDCINSHCAMYVFRRYYKFYFGFQKVSILHHSCQIRCTEMNIKRSIFTFLFFFYFNLSRFPNDDRFAPPIGNGYLATNVFSDAIYVDGVFNGYREDSHRARIPSTASIRVTSGAISEVYRLDMRNGMYLPENQIFLHKIY